MTPQTITAADMAAIPRPVRIGSDLSILDQAHALRTMAPQGTQEARAWLARTVFAVNRDGGLDRRVRSPVATVEGKP